MLPSERSSGSRLPQGLPPRTREASSGVEGATPLGGLRYAQPPKQPMLATSAEFVPPSLGRGALLPLPATQGYAATDVAASLPPSRSVVTPSRAPFTPTRGRGTPSSARGPARARGQGRVVSRSIPSPISPTPSDRPEVEFVTTIAQPIVPFASGVTKTVSLPIAVSQIGQARTTQPASSSVEPKMSLTEQIVAPTLVEATEPYITQITPIIQLPSPEEFLRITRR